MYFFEYVAKKWGKVFLLLWVFDTINSVICILMEVFDEVFF